MGMHIDGMAAAALATGAQRRRLLAKPGPRQRQCQIVLPQSGGPGQQPGMTALRQQGPALLSHPGRSCTVAHASQPLPCTERNTCSQTASREASASMRAKRQGLALMRCE